MLRRPVLDIIHPSIVKAVEGSSIWGSPSLQRAIGSIELALNHGHHVNTRLSQVLHADYPVQHVKDIKLRKPRPRPETLLSARTDKLLALVDDQIAVLLAAVEDLAVDFRTRAVLEAFQDGIGALGAPEHRDASMHWDIVAEQVGVDLRPFHSPATLQRLERIRSLVDEVRIEARQLALEEDLRALVVASSPVLRNDHQVAWEKAGIDLTTTSARSNGLTESTIYRTLLLLNGPGLAGQDKSVAVDDDELREHESISLGFFTNREVSIVYEKEKQKAITRALERIKD